MTISIVQSNSNDQYNATTRTTLAQAFGVSVTSGSCIIVIVSWQSTGATRTVTVSDGNSYTDVGSQGTDSGGVQSQRLFYYPNHAGGSTTVTATFSGLVNYCAITVVEVSGLHTTTPFDQVVYNAQEPPGTTTDAITSTALTPNQNDSLFVGYTQDTNNITNATLTAGTDYTMQNQSSTNSGFLFGTETYIQTTAASKAATFTQTTNDYRLTSLSIWKPPAGVTIPVMMHHRQTQGIS